MSTTPTFTTTVKDFPASSEGRHEAFTSSQLSHKCGTVTISGIASDSGRDHVSGFLHDVDSVIVEPGFTTDGEPAVRLRLAGDVSISLTIFGISPADLLAAATKAVEAQS